MQTLRDYLLRVMPAGSNWASDLHRYEWTPYRDCYIVSIDPTYKKRMTFIYLQKRLERLRPVIDYIPLYDDRLLVGFSSNFDSIRKSAIELNYESLLDHMRIHLQVHQRVLNSLKCAHGSQPLSTTHPEYFI